MIVLRHQHETNDMLQCSDNPYVAVITKPRKCNFCRFLTFSNQIILLCILHIMTKCHNNNLIVITIT